MAKHIKKAFIFGAYTHNEHFWSTVEEKYEILGFIDNNSSLWDKSVNGIKVFPPSIVKQKLFDIIIIDTNIDLETYAPIKEQFAITLKKILSYGIDKSKIIYDL